MRRATRPQPAGLAGARKRAPELSRDDLARVLAKSSGLTIGVCRDALRELFDQTGIIAQVLAKGGKVSLIGFGTLSAPVVPARTVRNPATGETIEAPAARRVRFKAGRPLRELVGASAVTPDDARAARERVDARASRQRSGQTNDDESDDDSALVALVAREESDNESDDESDDE